MMLAVIAFIIFMETSQRRIPVQYAKRVVGRKMYGRAVDAPAAKGEYGRGYSAYICIVDHHVSGNNLRISSTHPCVKKFAELLTPGIFLHEVFYIGFIIFFCYFYTAIVFNPDNVADNMKKYGGYIPGIRPGKKTSEYIERVLTRITFIGAIYISFVCVLPTLLVKKFNVPFYFGGTAFLIVVGVALDTIQQIESHLILRHYDGLVKKSQRMKGRR